MFGIVFNQNVEYFNQKSIFNMTRLHQHTARTSEHSEFDSPGQMLRSREYYLVSIETLLWGDDDNSLKLLCFKIDVARESEAQFFITIDVLTNILTNILTN